MKQKTRPAHPLSQDAKASANRSALYTLFAIVFIDILGYTLVLPLLPFYSEHLGASPLMVGMIVAVFGFCQLISGPFLGKLSDRFGRKPILILSQIGTCLGFVLLAQATSLFMVLIARIIDGVTAGNIVVAQAYVADTTTPQERTRAMGLIGAAFGLGFVLGPGLSGLLVGHSPAAPIWAAAFLSLITIVSSALFLKETVQKNQSKGIVNLPQARAFELLASNRQLVICLIVYLFFCLAFGIFTSGLALFSERVLIWNGKPFGAREVGYVLALSGFCSLLAQIFLVGRAVKTLGERKMAWMGFIGMASGVILCGLTTYVGSILSIFLLGTVIHSVSAGFVRPSLNGLMSQSAPAERQGFVFGMGQTALSTSNILAPIVAGSVIEIGAYYAWALAAFAFSSTGAYLVFSSRALPPRPLPA